MVALRSVGATVLLLRTLFGWSLYGDYGGLYLARAVLWGSTGGGDTGRAPVSGNNNFVYGGTRVVLRPALLPHPLLRLPRCLLGILVKGLELGFRVQGLGLRA